jgi:erythromycin esterase-like protein
MRRTPFERALHPLALDGERFDVVLDRIGDASIVALGEATHGTREFYEARRIITTRLVEERGFGAIVVEADWPDAHRVDAYVRGESADRNAHEALGDFTRFPRWMWRNEETVRLVEWLRSFNDGRLPEQRVGFYGMDLYSLHRSMEAVIAFLEPIDHRAAERARSRYACFDELGSDPQHYGRVISLGLAPDCQQQAVDQLMDMLHQAEVHARSRGLPGIDAGFVAEQNARVVKNAEHYYRGMFGGRTNTWNLRDHHMTETVDHLRDHLRGTKRSDKVCVWAHNSHLGDARATDLGDFGQLNVGQLLRERHGDDVVLVGFTTYGGTVTAASRWDGPAELKRVRSALAGSWEERLHALAAPRFALVTRDAREELSPRRLHRAIGVVYLPHSERMSHYFHADLATQFDVVLHYDQTHALEPLERWSVAEADVGETYPFGV